MFRSTGHASLLQSLEVRNDCLVFHLFPRDRQILSLENIMTEFCNKSFKTSDTSHGSYEFVF